jgi:hypothetical protein
LYSSSERSMEQKTMAKSSLPFLLFCNWLKRWSLGVNLLQADVGLYKWENSNDTKWNEMKQRGVWEPKFPDPPR